MQQGFDLLAQFGIARADLIEERTEDQ